MKKEINDFTKKTKDNITNGVAKLSNKFKTTINEEQMHQILNTLYEKSINGIPNVSLPIDDLINDYLCKNDDVNKAAKSLITNSTVKCCASGFITSFGGFTTMIATLPANITSVLYVQLRMCCAIAKMGGYEINSDQVQTLVLVCLTGSSAIDILKNTGIKFTNKLGKKMIEKIPIKTIRAINKKVGFRFITKFGETGVVTLSKVVPVISGFVGGGVDAASTSIIGKNAYNLFIKGKIPNDEDLKDTYENIEYEQIDDIDTKTLNDALNNKKI